MICSFWPSLDSFSKKKLSWHRWGWEWRNEELSLEMFCWKTQNTGFLVAGFSWMFLAQDVWCHIKMHLVQGLLGWTVGCNQIDVDNIGLRYGPWQHWFLALCIPGGCIVALPCLFRNVITFYSHAPRLLGCPMFTLRKKSNSCKHKDNESGWKSRDSIWACLLDVPLNISQWTAAVSRKTTSEKKSSCLEPDVCGVSASQSWTVKLFKKRAFLRRNPNVSLKNGA